VASETFTLAVDCGGSGIKAAVLDAAGTPHHATIRVPTPYPLAPTRLVETLAELAERLPPAVRVTVGMPGMIRHGVVVSTPHYVNRAGPRTAPLPDLVEAWSGCDIRAMVAERLCHACARAQRRAGARRRRGLGRRGRAGAHPGTGLGWALFDGGRLAPHLEMSHAPVTRATTYDSYIGQHERARLGDALWSRRVRRSSKVFVQWSPGTGSTWAAATRAGSAHRFSTGWATMSSSCRTRPASSVACVPGRSTRDEPVAPSG